MNGPAAAAERHWFKKALTQQEALVTLVMCCPGPSAVCDKKADPPHLHDIHSLMYQTKNTRRLLSTKIF